MRNILDWFNEHIIIKNLVLIVCAVVVLGVVMNVVLGVATQHNRHKIVPDFSGMTLDEARRAGRGGALLIEVNDSVYRADAAPGAILSQLPEAGSEVKSGRRVLVMTNAREPMMVRVPAVTGVSLRQAANDLRTAGFVVKELIFRSDLATDYVLETRYGAQRITRGGKVEAAQGAGITLIVGTNGEAAAVPKVVGLSAAEARWTLWSAGLNVAMRGEGAVVSRQSTGAGAELVRGSSVTITLSDE